MRVKKEVKEIQHDYGFGEDSALVFKPIESLQKAIEDKEWFKGIILSGIYIEHFGREKLRKKFARTISEEKLRNLDLMDIILLLFASKCIDQSTYSKLNEIRERRNDIMHNVWEKLGIDANEARPLIKKAIKCIQKLSS